MTSVGVRAPGIDIPPQLFRLRDHLEMQAGAHDKLRACGDGRLGLLHIGYGARAEQKLLPVPFLQFAQKCEGIRHCHGYFHHCDPASHHRFH